MSLRRLYLFSLVLALTTSSAGACHASPANADNKPGTPVFWIGTSYNEILDKQVLQFIAKRGSYIILNAKVYSKTPGFDYRSIVEGIHAISPKLPVLLYSWATVVHPRAVRVGGAIGKGYAENGGMLLQVRRKKKNAPPNRDRKVLFGNPASEQYRNWMSSRISQYNRSLGTNGVLLDSMFRSLIQGLRHNCKINKGYCVRYQKGVQALLVRISKALKGGFVFYNGLWNKWQGLLASQVQLLPYADGASIEFFGRYPKKNIIPPFSQAILPYLKIIAANPDKTFFVFGRGARSYTDYRADYLWQRYLYCAYLLIARANTHFHYNSTFQLPSPGRANAISWYRDWDVPLGKPLGNYRVENDLYSRKFTNGVVFLLPRGVAGKRNVNLTGQWYNPEGVQVKGPLHIQPGQGILLSRTLPPKEWEPGAATNANTVSPASFTAIGASPRSGLEPAALHHLLPGEDGERDLLLDAEHALNAPACLKLTLKTKDPNARLLLVSAVDDSEQRNETAVIVLSATKSRKTKSRTRWQANGAVFGIRATANRGKMPYLAYGSHIPHDGQWHTLKVCGSKVFSHDNHLSFQQWKFMRPIGAIKLKDVRLLKSNPDG